MIPKLAIHRHLARPGRLRRRPRYQVRLAEPHQIDEIITLIDGAAGWLRANKRTTQWRRPWPSEDARYERIDKGIGNGHTWLVWDGDRAIASVTVVPYGQEQLWTEQERRTDAVYVHRLVIDRDYAGSGLGAELINWAGRQGRERHPTAESIRIDVWSDNQELHAYYQRQGFRFVGERETDDRTPSGALFEKPIGLALRARTPRLVTGRPGRPPEARRLQARLRTAMLAIPMFTVAGVLARPGRSRWTPAAERGGRQDGS